MGQEADRRRRFEELFDVHYWSVRAYVLRRGPSAAAEDVVAETFLVAWRRLDALGEDPLPWLLGVARRVLANQQRAERRRGALAARLQALFITQIPEWEPPAEMSDELAVAMVRLSPPEREALLLDRQRGTVTPDDRVIAQLAEANPVAGTHPPDQLDRAEADRIMRRVLAAPPPPRRRGLRSGLIAPVLSAVVVLIVAAVVLRTGGSSTAGSSSQGGLKITLTAQPTSQTPHITPGVMSHELSLVRHRLRSVLHRFRVTRAQGNAVVVTGPKVSAAQRARIIRLITQPAQLVFYDWEANVLAPNGHTVAQQLAAQNPSALAISQGGSAGAGQPGAGSMSLYDAVRLAARQPRRDDGGALTRRGAEYYMFGAPGSAACTAAAAAAHTAPVSGAHCLLAGPVDVAASGGSPQALNALAAQLPAGVSPDSGRVIAVPQGTRVLGAERPAAAAPLSLSDPSAQFFVLRDHPELSGVDIVDPSATRDQGGTPAVNFGFTASGRRAFQRATAQIARRGANVSLAGQELNQHFAVVLDDQVVTVPSISYQQYPDGILGDGADITGGLTAQSALDLATQLRYGALPLALRVVS